MLTPSAHSQGSSELMILRHKYKITPIKINKINDNLSSELSSIYLGMKCQAARTHFLNIQLVRYISTSPKIISP